MIQTKNKNLSNVVQLHPKDIEQNFVDTETSKLIADPIAAMFSSYNNGFSSPNRLIETFDMVYRKALRNLEPESLDRNVIKQAIKNYHAGQLDDKKLDVYLENINVRPIKGGAIIEHPCNQGVLSYHIDVRE